MEPPHDKRFTLLQAKRASRQAEGTLLASTPPGHLRNQASSRSSGTTGPGVGPPNKPPAKDNSENRRQLRRNSSFESSSSSEGSLQTPFLWSYTAPTPRPRRASETGALTKRNSLGDMMESVRRSVPISSHLRRSSAVKSTSEEFCVFIVPRMICPACDLVDDMIPSFGS